MADIILSNICKRFGEKTLFENFSLKIERGEFLSIMGESGAGKTTLLNMMGLLDRPDSGTVVLCGQKNPAFSSRTAVNLRRRHISYLFQNYGLIDTETVENNMRIATHFKSMRRKDWYGYHIERTVEPKTASVPAVSRISKISDFALERMRCINFGTTIMVFSW